jgi:hypothetical protein
MLQIVLFVVLGALAAQQPDTTATETHVRLDESLSIRTRDAATQPTRVSLRDWVVRNGQKATLTATGMLVVHLRGGGPAFTTMNGVRTERKDEEFFVVPPGAVVEVETAKETCVFTILEVRR